MGQGALVSRGGVATRSSLGLPGAVARPRCRGRSVGGSRCGGAHGGTPGLGCAGSAAQAGDISMQGTYWKFARLSGYKAKCREGDGLTQRHRVFGPRNRPRAERTDALGSMTSTLGARHKGVNDAGADPATESGTQGAKATEAAVRTLRVHQRRLLRGHRLVWQAQWTCRTCSMATHRLTKTMCTWRRLHPTPETRGRGALSTGTRCPASTT